MASSTVYRRRSRGRPALGFLIDVPDGLELHDGAVVTCREVRDDGRLVGELEIAVFAAALVIDRDGILAEKARAALGHGAANALAVRLPGAHGFRSEAVASAPLPYVCAFALAPNDLGVDGGLLITIRSARPDWPAADQVLGSLRLLKRNGTVDESADDEPDAAALPVIARG